MAGVRRSHILPAPVILGVLGLGAFITSLDQTVVVTALPNVMLDLKIPVTELDRASWIVTAYLLGFISAMPLLGRMSDVYGRAKVYRASMVVFAVGSVLVAVSPNLEWMIGARVIQALGGGAAIPIGLAMGSIALPARHRGLALGIVVAAAEVGAMLGPAYGGAVISLLDWRWIFWLNLPLTAVLFMALLTLPDEKQVGGRVDYLGGALLAATLVILTIALSRGGLFTLSSPVPFIIGAPAAALGVALVVVERRTWQPLLAPALFRSKAFVTANLTQLMEGVALIIALVTVPLMADTVMGKDALTGGWWLLRLTGMIPVGAVAGGYLLTRIGVRTVTVLGLGLGALGLYLVSTWELDISEPWLTMHLLIVGLGFGLNNAPIMTRALSTVGLDYRSTVASLVVVSRMIGMALGLAALAAWGVEHFQALTSGLAFPVPVEGESSAALDARQIQYTEALSEAGLALFHRFFQIASFVSLVAILPALAMRADKREVEELG